MILAIHPSWKWMGRRQREKVLVVLLAMMAAAAGAQTQQQEEPRWLSFHLAGGYLSLDAEGEQQTESSGPGGAKTSSQRLYVAPAVGLAGVGSIYHPDLFSFSLKAEPGYVWQQTGVDGSKNTENSFLQSYDFSGTALQLKPYSTMFFANAGHQNYQYDFFNSVIADQQTWGFNTGYRTGPVPVTVTFQDSHQDINGLTSETKFDQLSLNLHAHNDRSHGDATDLTYLYGQYGQTIGDGSGGDFKDTSSYHQVNLTDVEHFGSKSTLNSTILYNHLEALDLASDNVTATSDLTVDHTDYLRSFYDYAFSHYDDDFSDVNQNFVRAGLQHQLYESLSSSFDVHGSDLSSSSMGSSFDSKSGGVLGSLNYTKRLGSWGLLSFGNAVGYDITQQDTSGAIVAVPQESHSTTAANAFFRLKQPLVTSITSVTGDALHGFAPLQEGPDYTVNRGVDPWQITINFASLTVQSLESGGSVTVLVSYNVKPNPSGSYATFSDQFNARLSLFRGMLAFYSRLDYIQNSIDTPGFVLQNLTEWNSGVDFNWRGLLLNANYLNHHSSLYDYTAKSLSEGYSLTLDDTSRVGVELRQQWSDYSDLHESATYYDFLGHYEWQDPRLHLRWRVEGGLQRQRGLGLDQDFWTARTQLEWFVGKIRLHLGYDYQNQDFNGLTRMRHYAYLRFQRYF